MSILYKKEVVIMPANAIRKREDIERIKHYFLEQNNFAYDRHLLFFVLGVNTCLKPRDLSSLKWSDILLDGNILRDYIEYNGYRFYFNNNCKNSIIDYMEKYKDIEKNVYMFEGIGNKKESITYQATNKVYSKIQDILQLDFEFSNISLHKTFVYWQIYYCHRDYVKMSKLRLLTRESTLAKERDLNTYANFNIPDDMIYINDVNL